MEPIKITSLDARFANAILNNQEKLNPHKDAYIDEDELPGVLAHFGVQDISELMPKNEKTGLDTFEKETSDKTSDTENNSKADYNNLFNNKLTMNTTGTSAERMMIEGNSDLSLSGTGSEFGGLYNSLQDKKLSKINNGEDIFDINRELEMIEDCIKDGNTDQQKEVQNIFSETNVNVIKYGKNNEKTALYAHTIGIGGSNAMYDKNKKSTEEDSENQENNSNLANYDISYVGRFTTQDNTDVYINMNGGSDNLDIHLAGSYNKKTNNNGEVMFGTLASITIDPEKSVETRVGLSTDYNNESFTCGAYGYFNNNTSSDYSFSEYKAEGYAKYKNLRLAAGAEKPYEDMNYYYSQLNFTGSKPIEDCNLELTGTVSAEAGLYEYKGESDSYQISNLKAKVRGGIKFKTQDFSASFNGNLAYQCLIDTSEQKPEDRYNHDISLSFLGSLTKGKIRVSAMVSAFKDIFAGYENEAARVSSSVTLEYKDLINNMTPYFYYTLNNSKESRPHEIGLGMNMPF